MRRILAGIGCAVLAAAGLAQGAELNIGPYNTTFSSDRTRGFWFTAPTDFVITGVRVPTDVGTDPQNVQVVRFNSPVTAYPTMTTDFVSLYYAAGVAGTDWISTTINVSSGDIIGIIGARGSGGTMNNSYAGTFTFDTEFFGLPTTLHRLGTQFPIDSASAPDFFTETSVEYSRVEVQYAPVPEPTMLTLLLVGPMLLGRRNRAA